MLLSLDLQWAAEGEPGGVGNSSESKQNQRLENLVADELVMAFTNKANM